MEVIGVDGYEYGPPATPQQINAVEEQLGSRLPMTLRDLYLRSNGVLDKAGQWWVIWPLDRLVESIQSAWNYAGCRDSWWRLGTMGRAIPSA